MEFPVNPLSGFKANCTRALLVYEGNAAIDDMGVPVQNNGSATDSWNRDFPI